MPLFQKMMFNSFRMSLYALQTMQCQMDKLNYNTQLIHCQHQQGPCIAITGLRNLYKRGASSLNLYATIYKLFNSLQIPAEWILFIGHPPRITTKPDLIPFEAYIFLVCDSIKLIVNKKLLNYLKKTKQRLVHIKMINL